MRFLANSPVFFRGEHHSLRFALWGSFKKGLPTQMLSSSIVRRLELQTGWMAWLVCRWTSAPKIADTTRGKSVDFQDAENQQRPYHNYTACKRSLERLFGLGALDKMKS
ncbi:hypothetical protein TNCV_3347621 [Trichonephila clavipes]|nr:hypothetical protein TNCV_3347621 [Trichonephila clavipes]